MVSEENLEIYLKSHFIDMEDLENDNFENFICHRAKKILKEICKVTGKEFSEPSDEELKQIFFESKLKKIPSTKVVVIFLFAEKNFL
ncbi:MAG: hypothetical protein IK062_06260 [Selenomonadaceae bacterium]|nr:hypothetical protein [Selenomonadaceae bacterium]